jgi:hypothetical protein
MRILGTILLLLAALSQENVQLQQTGAKENADTRARAAAIAFISQPNATAADANAALAISIWYDLNTMCRGGMHDPEVNESCCLRNKIDALLDNLGYCYHMGDTWKKCRAGEKRRTRNVYPTVAAATRARCAE